MHRYCEGAIVRLRRNSLGVQPKAAVARASASFLPQTMEEFRLLLRIFLLEKAIYELGYELNNRPDWVQIPLRGTLDILGERVG